MTFERGIFNTYFHLNPSFTFEMKLPAIWTVVQNARYAWTFVINGVVMETGQETSEHIFMGGAPLNKFLSMKCIYNHCIIAGGGVTPVRPSCTSQEVYGKFKINLTSVGLH